MWSVHACSTCKLLVDINVTHISCSTVNCSTAPRQSSNPVIVTYVWARASLVRRPGSLTDSYQTYMGQLGQFGLNGFKWGQTHFSQLPISLDPDELESCHFVCSLIIAMRLLKLHVWSVSQNRPQSLMHIIRRFIRLAVL